MEGQVLVTIYKESPSGNEYEIEVRCWVQEEWEYRYEYDKDEMIGHFVEIESTYPSHWKDKLDDYDKEKIEEEAIEKLIAEDFICEEDDDWGDDDMGVERYFEERMELSA